MRRIIRRRRRRRRRKGRRSSWRRSGRSYWEEEGTRPPRREGDADGSQAAEGPGLRLHGLALWSGSRGLELHALLASVAPRPHRARVCVCVCVYTWCVCVCMCVGPRVRSFLLFWRPGSSPPLVCSAGAGSVMRRVGPAVAGGGLAHFAPLSRPLRSRDARLNAPSVGLHTRSRVSPERVSKCVGA